MANLYNKAGLVNIPIGYSDGFLYNIKPVDDTLAFRFNRDSAATRVNKEGLIEQVGYFGPELVQNGDFSELGPELVTNGDFSDGSTDWINVDGSATFINNYVKIQSQGSTLNRIRQIDVTQVGKTFKLSYEIIENNNVSEFKYYNGTEYVTTTSTVGTHTVYFVAGSNDDLFFNVADTNTDDYIIINNVSVKQVDPNDYWTLGTGWSFGDGKAVCDGTNLAYLTQLAILNTGTPYKVQFDIVDYTSGSVKYRDNGLVSGQSFSGVGSYTDYVVAGGGQFRLMSENFIGSIDNVSVVEVLGDKPRIDYTDSLTSPSFLLEPQRTNLVLYSEDMSEWANTEVSLETGYTAPDGSTNAYKITDNSTNSLHRILDVTSSTPSSGDFIYSIFLKKGTMTNAVLNVYSNGTKAVATIDLDSVTIVASGGGVNAKIEDYGNDWYRCSVGGTFGSSSTNVYLYLSDTKNPYIGNDEFLYAWGAQLEAGSYATSYIPTAGSTVTRAEETCNGAGNASTFNSTEGVLYAEVLPYSQDGRISLNDGTIDKNVRFTYQASNNTIFGILFNGSNQAILTYQLPTENEFYKIAFKYKSSDFSLFVNGIKVNTLIGSGTTFTSGTLSELDFDAGNGLVPFYGKTKGFYVFNEALTDDELQQLTGPEYNSFAALAAAYNYTVI